MKSIYLLADSIPLFSKTTSGEYCLQNLTSQWSTDTPLAAYIGASNGNVPDYFELFEAGMEHIGIHNCVHISEEFDERDRGALAAADLVLLSGGDTLRGWRWMQTHGVANLLLSRYQQGVILMGISAGAIQLGWGMMEGEQAIPMLGLVPYLIDVHDEKRNWANLHLAVQKNKEQLEGLGVYSGSCLLYQEEHWSTVIGTPAIKVHP